MNELKYNPTSKSTPNPKLLKKLKPEHCGKWIPVNHSLPPEKLNVIVIVRGDNCPAFAWLRFGGGDKACPYFVVPQNAAMKPRGTHEGKPDHCKFRTDATHWFSATPEGIPCKPQDCENYQFGLSAYGWETKGQALNPDI